MKLLIVTGMHNAGKTTLIANILLKENVVALPEIGGNLRNNSKCLSWQSCSIFDELVMLREFERDHLLMNYNSVRYVLLEQWHIGNLAYALIRSPSVAEEYEHRLQGYLHSLQIPITCFHLSISIEDLVKRENIIFGQNDLDSFIDLYQKLDKMIIKVYDKLGLCYTNIDGTISPEINQERVFQIEKENRE